MTDFGIEPRGQFNRSNNAIDFFLEDQRNLKESKPTVDEFLNPLDYLDKQNEELLVNQKREGEVDKTAYEETPEIVSYPSFYDFIHDERLFPNHTIDAEYINPTPMLVRLPYHDLDGTGQKTIYGVYELGQITKEQYELLKDNVDQYENFLPLRMLDDLSGAPMPNVHPDFIKQDKTSL